MIMLCHHTNHLDVYMQEVMKVFIALRKLITMDLTLFRVSKGLGLNV